MDLTNRSIMDIEKLKYPIGKFEWPKEINVELLNSWISVISEFPTKLKVETAFLTEDQLDTRYRPDGWTIRQVVHHCADSHMNSLMRLKLALTEDQPIIKPYYEEKWAELPDSRLPIGSSLLILDGIHQRWATILRNLTKEQLGRTFIHPDSGRSIRIDANTALYAWHCNHHLAHITETKKRNNWS